LNFSPFAVRIWPEEVKMTEPLEERTDFDSDSKASLARDFAQRLSEEERMLVILKSQLYDGSWEPMLDDLKNRLTGKPYIFKLASRIKDDVERIEKMRKFELEHGVNLADFVELQ
jgi:hypothetical protein